MANQPEPSCSPDETGVCPLGINPVTISSINGQLGNLNRLVVATREDVVALRTGMEHLEQGMAEVKKRQDDQADTVRELEDTRLIRKSQWNGPKALLATALSIGGLITIVGAAVNILAAFGVVGS